MCTASQRARLRRDAVVDPATGNHIFVSPEEFTVEDTSRSKAPVPTLAVAIADAPNSTSLGGAVSAGIQSRSSLKSSGAYRSMMKGIEEVRRAAILAVKISEMVVNKILAAPVSRKVTRQWNTFHAYRRRNRVLRRSHTLDWFEERIVAKRQAEEMYEAGRLLQGAWQLHSCPPA